MLATVLATVVLVWEPPATREDGSLLLHEEIQEYTLYVSDRKGVVKTRTVYGSSVEIKGKACKRYGVSATDTDGLESKVSNIIEVCKKKHRWTQQALKQPKGNQQMSLDTDYFYKMAAPVRVLASNITDRMGRVNGQGAPVEQGKGIPYGLDKEEMIVYARDQFGLLLSRKMTIATMVGKVYEAGSNLDGYWARGVDRGVDRDYGDVLGVRKGS
jgi:hypothetical protein